MIKDQKKRAKIQKKPHKFSKKTENEKQIKI